MSHGKFRKGGKTMSLRSDELARSPFTPGALPPIMCPVCSFVGHWEGSDCPDVPCPNCGATGEIRQVFPDGSAYKLLKMLTYFHKVAIDRTSESENRLIAGLAERLGRACAKKEAHRALEEVHRIYSVRRRRGQEYDRAAAAMQKLLSIDSDAEAREVVVLLLAHHETVEEHAAVVILTCTLLEKLLDDLLVLMAGTRDAQDYRTARQTVKSLGRFDDRKKLFKKISRISLAAAVERCPAERFWSTWCGLRKTRNHFVHGQPFAISVSTAEHAFRLATNSVPVFAFLQNLTCLSKQTDG